MKILKTISIFSLSAFLIGGAFISFGVQAKTVDKKDVETAVSRKLADTAKSAGLDIAVEAHILPEGRVNIQVKPKTREPFTMRTVLTAFNKIDKDAKSLATILNTPSTAIKRYCNTGEGQGNGTGDNKPAEDLLHVDSYYIEYDLPTPNIKGGQIDVRDSQWDGVFGPFVFR